MMQRTVITRGIDDKIIFTQQTRDSHKKHLPLNIGGVARTNRVVRTNQSLELIGFFQCERSTNQREARRAKRN